LSSSSSLEPRCATHNPVRAIHGMACCRRMHRWRSARTTFWLLPLHCSHRCLLRRWRATHRWGIHTTSQAAAEARDCWERETYWLALGFRCGSALLLILLVWCVCMWFNQARAKPSDIRLQRGQRCQLVRPIRRINRLLCSGSCNSSPAQTAHRLPCMQSVYHQFQRGFRSRVAPDCLTESCVVCT
jgi:hypothetical protein